MLRAASQDDPGAWPDTAPQPAPAPVAPMADSSDDDDDGAEIDWEAEFGPDAIAE